MATYYATVKVEGTASSQDFKVTAQSGSEAKKIIEMRVGGKVKFMDPLTDPGAQGAALIPGLTAARGQRGVGTPAGAIAPARRRLPGRVKFCSVTISVESTSYPDAYLPVRAAGSVEYIALESMS